MGRICPTDLRLTYLDVHILGILINKLDRRRWIHKRDERMVSFGLEPDVAEDAASDNTVNILHRCVLGNVAEEDCPVTYSRYDIEWHSANTYCAWIFDSGISCATVLSVVDAFGPYFVSLDMVVTAFTALAMSVK